MLSTKYKEQVDLLIQILPHVAKEESLALKGGTAINLFVRNMPRLSVDIDLTYTSITDDRQTALQHISEAVIRIDENIRKAIPGISVTHIPPKQGDDVKLNCQMNNAHVKIEVNTVTRGIIFPVRMMALTDLAQAEFGKFAAIQVVSHGELFGGKICAALDRQHPRDLFDIHHLIHQEGFSDEVRLGFIMFLVSHHKPVHDLLFSHHHDHTATLEQQFAGMTVEPFTYETYETTRRILSSEIRKILTENDKKFLISFENGTPDWNLVAIESLKDLPAVKWKLQNIHKLIEQNPSKHLSGIKGLTEKLNNSPEPTIYRIRKLRR
ncbi:MAG: nucleotidyl transferase AbiEii/AbiGii toxin family protein [Azospira oryzae]|jgi:predicted nucleotidyltransferase component of viral defense system|nr:nucleotidyl transferase AbiEii/AbiGii toxin family protein [Cytophaga sp.]PZR30691.1 MAG: nucleotidyl transferase AbiEii/AbiGii toxin family protein [Azospira oryzae]